MRGCDGRPCGLCSCVRLAKRTPEDHPLRPIRKAASKELARVGLGQDPGPRAGYQAQGNDRLRPPRALSHGRHQDQGNADARRRQGPHGTAHQATLGKSPHRSSFRLHGLRHSLAGAGPAVGGPLPLTGKLILPPAATPRQPLRRKLHHVRGHHLWHDPSEPCHLHRSWSKNTNYG